MSFSKLDMLHGCGKADALEHFYYLQIQAVSLTGDFIDSYSFDSQEFVANVVWDCFQNATIQDINNPASELLPSVLENLVSFNNIDPADACDLISQKLHSKGWVSNN